MLIVLLLLLAAVAAAALALLWLVVRGHNKRLLLAGYHAVASDTPDGIGISVLCSGVRVQEQVENLLSAEYAHYEVIVVLDSLRYPVEFAAYDYVLPVREGQFLLPDAVARLVAEVGERGVGGCDCVRSRIGEPAALLSREAVVAAGGFARRPGKAVPWRRRRSLWEPVCYTPQSARRQRFGLQVVLRVVPAAALAAAIVAAVWTGRWPAAAVLLTAALVWCVAGCVSLSLSDIACGRTGGGEKGLLRRCKIGVKNFTIS